MIEKFQELSLEDLYRSSNSNKELNVLITPTNRLIYLRNLF